MAFKYVSCDGNVNGDLTRKPMSGKHEQQAGKAANNTGLALLAMQTIPVTPCLEMSRTDGTVRLMDQETVRTDGLIAVVLDDDRLARERTEDQRRKSGARNVDDVGCSNDAP